MSSAAAAAAADDSGGYILGIPSASQSEESLYHVEPKKRPQENRDQHRRSAAAAHLSLTLDDQRKDDLASKDSGISGSSDSPLSCAATPVREHRGGGDQNRYVKKAS